MKPAPSPLGNGRGDQARQQAPRPALAAPPRPGATDVEQGAAPAARTGLQQHGLQDCRTTGGLKYTAPGEK